jgi:hypothetical protein
MQLQLVLDQKEVEKLYKLTVLAFSSLKKMIKKFYWTKASTSNVELDETINKKQVALIDFVILGDYPRDRHIGTIKFKNPFEPSYTEEITYKIEFKYRDDQMKNKVENDLRKLICENEYNRRIDLVRRNKDLKGDDLESIFPTRIKEYKSNKITSAILPTNEIKENLVNLVNQDIFQALNSTVEYPIINFYSNTKLVTATIPSLINFELVLFGNQSKITHIADSTNGLKTIEKLLEYRMFNIKNLLFEVRISFNNTTNQYKIGYVGNELVPIRYKNFLKIKEKYINSIQISIVDAQTSEPFLCTGYCILHFE